MSTAPLPLTGYACRSVGEEGRRESERIRVPVLSFDCLDDCLLVGMSWVPFFNGFCELGSAYMWLV